MNIFRNEETRVAEKIDVVVPRFEAVGQRGRIIADKLHRIRNVLDFPKSSKGHTLLGSDLCAKDVGLELDELKNELDDYAEEAKVVIGDVTNILTEIRLHTVTLWVFPSAFSGRNLLIYLLSIVAGVFVSSLVRITAVICDNEVTGAFTANALSSRQFPLYCMVDTALLSNNRTELVFYIARQARIAYGAQQFSEWIVTVFLVCIIYSYYRSQRERKFILTVEGQVRIVEDAKAILIRWLLKHGHPTPAFLNSRYIEVEYPIESSRFAGNDTRSESDYDELSESDEEMEKKDDTTEPEASPEPSHIG